jgi:hypothetical protein
MGYQKLSDLAPTKKEHQFNNDEFHYFTNDIVITDIGSLYRAVTSVT